MAKSYVVLIDGSVLECTPQQQSKLGMAIIMSEDPTKTRVRLNDRTFKLSEIETNPKKLKKSMEQTLQQGMDLGDITKKRNNFA